MFGRLRTQLTLWYVGILALTLVAVGALVYVLVARSLDSQINSSLREVNRQAAQVLRETSQPAISGEGAGEGREHEDEEHGEEEEREDEYGAVLNADQLLGSTGDVFLVVLDPQGNVIANPRGIAIEELPVAAAVGSSLGKREVRQDTAVGDSHVRLLTVPVTDEAGRPVGFVMTGKSLEERDADLRRLLVLLAIGAGVGLVLAGAGGLWVAQLAIQPVRRAFERQRDFIADASHELRTPLAVVRANAESLLPKISGEERVALEDIVAETGHMGRLVADLLTLAQADRGDMELQRAAIDLHDVVNSVARAYRRPALDRGIEFSAQADHVEVTGDGDRLRQLLLVLVDNALKYTPAGGRVTLRAKRQRGRAEVVVEDTGIGIEEEHLPRLFDRFYRVDKARSRAEGGLGLGLSIAQAIVQAHGGTIEVDSTPGRGTRVRVTLPALIQRRGGAAQQAPPPVVDRPQRTT